MASDIIARGLASKISTPDSTLSPTSTSPIQNKVITTELTNLCANPNLLPILPEYWEQGVYGGGNGLPSDSTTRIRLKEFINVTPSTSYAVSKFLNGQICVYEYTSDETFVKMSTWYSGNAVITTQPTTEKN